MDNTITLEIMANEIGIIEMTISPAMEKMFQEEPFCLELEMLQGQRQERPITGMIWYRIAVIDLIKLQMIRDFATLIITGLHNKARMN